jgi:hypothetical protein
MKAKELNNYVCETEESPYDSIIKHQLLKHLTTVTYASLDDLYDKRKKK